MVILTYNNVDGFSGTDIITDVIKHSPKRIIIFNETEWELKILTPEIIEFLKDRQIEIEIVFGSFPGDYYKSYASEIGLDEKSFTFWPTYWFNWSSICLKSTIDFTTYRPPPTFKYPFISLNNKNHPHRVALIDHLAKYNLIDKGIVTWHKFSNIFSNYTFKYYDDSIRLIDDDFNIKLDSFLLPKEWHESFLHVVGEATSTVHFITEKTVIPLLMKKPFVCISKPGFNKRLLELGFKLYHEIIDYSYDEKDNMSDMADSLCKSIGNLGVNYNELYDILKPKIDYNYNRCLEIIKQKNFIPTTVVERVRQMDLPNYNPMHTDFRYEMMVKSCYD